MQMTTIFATRGTFYHSARGDKQKGVQLSKWALATEVIDLRENEAELTVGISIMVC